MTEAVARVLQASELMRHSSQEVVDAFLNTRSPAAAGGWGSMFGTMSVAIDKRRADRIVERANVFR